MEVFTTPIRRHYHITSDLIRSLSTHTQTLRFDVTKDDVHVTSMVGEPAILRPLLVCCFRCMLMSYLLKSMMRENKYACMSARIYG